MTCYEIFQWALRLHPDADIVYLTGGSGSRRRAISKRVMLKDDKPGAWPGRRIDFADFAAKLTARRAALGDDLVIPRNPGTRRTASKRALLKAIEASGGDW